MPAKIDSPLLYKKSTNSRKTVISFWLPSNMVKELDGIAREVGKSRSELACVFLKEGITQLEKISNEDEV